MSFVGAHLRDDEAETAAQNLGQLALMDDPCATRTQKGDPQGLHRLPSSPGLEHDFVADRAMVTAIELSICAAPTIKVLKEKSDALVIDFQGQQTG